MAVSHRDTGTPVFGINSITPGIPAGAAVTDMMLLISGGKPYNRGIGASPADQGWTSLGTFTDGTTAAGNDSGSMAVQAWYKEHSGSETDPTITEGSPVFNVMGGLVVAFQKGGSETWNTPVAGGGGDASSGTGFSASSAGLTTFATGDWFLSFAAFPTDAATPCSSHLTPAVAGVTFSNTHDPATDPETTTGGDMGMCVTRSNITAGSSSGFTAGLNATLAAASTGSAMMIKLGVTAIPSGPVHVPLSRRRAHRFLTLR